jgi:L-threonylcarbamoyladenylate synthase
MNSDNPIRVATPEAIALAAQVLVEGGLVAFPTETVYGLGADAANAQAVAGVYRLKGRPPDHPLIVHVSSLQQAARWAFCDARAEALATRFWPGPLTLILPLLDGAPDAACGGQKTIGMRVPSHPVSRALLTAFEALGGVGIAAPSANRFGRVSPTTASHVRDDLGVQAPLILDGGACAVGLESTIVDLSRDHAALLRPGGIPAAQIESVLGYALAEPDAAAPRVSGSLAAHYAPLTPLELVDASSLAGRLASLRARGLRLAVLAKGDRLEAEHWEAASTEPETYGHRLYDTLRRLDRLGVDRILVARVPDQPQWRAVADRLRRAAAGSGLVPE